MIVEKDDFETVRYNNQNRLIPGLCLLLIIGIIAIYGRTVRYDFVAFDDQSHVVNNPMVPGGLTWEGFKWAFTTTHAGYWCPMTWLSFMLDGNIFGISGGGFHLTNVVLHIANTLLLFWVLRRYTKELWASFFVAALFALHPLHVESVAWVTERKDVLSTLFWLFTMLSYIRFVEKRTIWRYVLILIFFATGLMAKPMVISLPFALLIMDYWPLRRLQHNKSVGVEVSYLVLEKMPMLVMSLISGMITAMAQKSSMAKLSVYSAGYRIENTLVSYGTYILKALYPFDLAVFYPHPAGGIAGWKIVVFATALLSVTFVVILFRRHRYLPAGWLWFMGTLVPVIGLVQVGRQAMADRYTYIPLTGLFIMLVWSIGDIMSKWQHKPIIAGIASSVTLLILSVISFIQVGYWRDTVSLFTHASSVTRDNYLAYSLLGTYYAHNNDFEKARSEIEKIKNVNNGETDVLYNVAKCLEMAGKPGEAMAYYNRILTVRPGDVFTIVALASIESDRGNFKSAMDLYREGLKFHPDNGELHSRIGTLLFQIGRIDDAEKELETAVRHKADSVIYCNYGVVLLAKGQIDKAVECFKMATRLDPANAEAHYNLGNIFLSQQLSVKAADEYKIAIKTKPNYIKAIINLGVALEQMGQLDNAIESYRRAVESDSNIAVAHYNLATTLATKGVAGEAIEHMRKYVGFEPGDTDARCKLAEMLLLQGRIEQATTEYEQVLKIDINNTDAQAGLEKIRNMNPVIKPANP